jgi:hypothetical protein
MVDCIINRVAQAIITNRNLPVGAVINRPAFLADARAALYEISRIFGETNNSCLNYAADEIDEALQ